MKTDEMLNICYASSNEYSQYTGISLLSALENNADIINQIFLLDYNISKDNLMKIKSICNKYDKDIVVIDAISKMKEIINNIELDTFEGSFATYSRAFISYLIPNEEYNLLYIDSDTIVDGSFGDLRKIDFEKENAVFAAVIGVNQYFENNNELKLNNGNRMYFQCGVILYNLKKWNEYRCSEKIVEYIKSNGSYYLYADQTLINNVIPEKLIVPIPPKYNYWGHMFRGGRRIYELTRGSFFNKKIVYETKKDRVIIHYKGDVIHPWLKGCFSSLKGRYAYYKKLSPWNNTADKSILYDEKKNKYSLERLKFVLSSYIWLRKPAFVVKFKERQQKALK